MIQNARISAGMVSKQAPARLVQLMLETGGLADRPRSGRPTEYPDDLMEIAVEALVEREEEYLNERQFRAIMIREGILKGNSDLANFIQHLKDFVCRQGHRLITCSTGTQFFLRKSDVQERLSYCESHVSFFTEKQLEMTVFIDETDYEESPHPKG